MQAGRWRWWVLSAFLLSSSLSFLDRQLLAAYAPAIKKEFGLDNTGYGWLVAAFSITYGLSAPLLGLVLDRWGLTRGSTVAVSAWSAIGVMTGFVRNFPGLLACRASLGLAEAAGIPASGKAYSQLLLPRERALGAALGQVGIALGLLAAPLLASRLPWRQAFSMAGLAGAGWVVLWLLVRPQETAAAGQATPVGQILVDRRIWALCAANVFAMVTYSLWVNWTTIYLEKQQHLTPQVANARFAWIPPVCATIGGFAGGWLSWWWSRTAPSLQAARWRVCALSAALLLPTALVPFASGATLATAGIALSFFLTLAISVNVYAMPLELFGAGRAAFATSLLTASYGLMQLPLAPLIGWTVDHYGFTPVCLTAAVMPLVAVTLLRGARLHE